MNKKILINFLTLQWILTTNSSFIDWWKKQTELQKESRFLKLQPHILTHLFYIYKLIS